MSLLPVPDFDLNLLLSLEALLAARSVSAAARAMGVGQPAMSKSLQRLREVLRDPVLVRTGREMVPTERATSLAPVLQEALQATRRLLAPPSPLDPKTASGVVRIAMSDGAHAVLATGLVERVQRHAPGLELRIRRLERSASADLARGDLHLVVMPDVEGLHGGGGPDLSEFVVRP